ncbi:MAG: FAD/NAD(P)-binding oxidoreductase [Candidatus Palauibacterales bacterium]|nr:FAD/NAD(P)-binding oxidoreductase [Candidatus Palauibacterales bacterium]
MARVLVLGGGFGGVSTATQLRRRLADEHEILLIDRSSTFVMGLRKLWDLFGIGSIAQGTRDLRALESQGIRFERREVLEIDPVRRTITTHRGSLEADYLVVALGAEPRPDLVPGLSEHAHNVWAASGVPGLKAALAAFAGGEIVVAIAGMPYPCPPAPFECAMLLEDQLRGRGLRGGFGITVTTPKPILLPNAGAEGSAWLAEQLVGREIGFETGREVKRVEAGVLDWGDARREFDLLIGVPPHRPPRVIADSALAGPGGWVTVDPGTFETGHQDVFAIGDVTKVTLANGLPLPKAGVMADLEGQRVAAAIAARISGAEAPEPFDGRGYCFLEMSASTAALIEGEFYSRPEPRIALADESAEHAQLKHRFEAERLESWFGG